MMAAERHEATEYPDLASTYGLRALATVVFDIDSGQKLDALHPTSCDLSEAAKTSLAHLALPHCNNQDEGDTQFIVRFRDGPDDRELLFGFVLFRQQKDESRTRGYFQKALVLISAKPYVDLYDRVLRVVGPLFFTVGPQVLAAVYNNIKSWPELVHDTPVVLPLAGTYISCIIPKLLDYEHLDTTYESDADSPLHSHFIAEEDDDATDVPDFNEADEGEEEEEDTEETVLNIGLYSSFVGLEESLWLLWQFAITGESFQGDCRPYFTVYEADFDTLAKRQNNGVSSPKDVTVVGTTNPFFMKLLRRCPRYMIPDVTVVRQLVSPPEVHITQTTSHEEEPYVTINNAILRKPRKLPPQIKQSKWRTLYTAFVKSPHFEPWFNYRRQRCIHDFANTLRTLRGNVDASLLLSSPFGDNLTQEQYLKLKKEMEVALALENGQSEVDKRQVRTIKKHMKAVKEKLRSFKQTQ
uniref:UDENN domain-containing protein n=1 Tax=Phytophthora ramorum TaxID=164328 RepID=H3HDW6_PHYRM